MNIINQLNTFNKKYINQNKNETNPFNQNSYKENQLLKSPKQDVFIKTNQKRFIWTI